MTLDGRGIGQTVWLSPSGTQTVTLDVSTSTDPDISGRDVRLWFQPLALGAPDVSESLVTVTRDYTNAATGTATYSFDAGALWTAVGSSTVRGLVVDGDDVPWFSLLVVLDLDGAKAQTATTLPAVVGGSLELTATLSTVAGSAGPAGADGKTVLSGAGAPSDATDGTDGDFWIDTTGPTLYGPKAAGVWGSGTSMVGPSGSGTGDLLAANNLSDVADAPTARTNLGLGDSAGLDVGTTAGTVAAGDDSRFGGSGSGDVVGPGSAVDSNFAAFDTTTGKLIKDSGSAAASFATAAQGTDARTPTAHKTSHEDGGADELALDASQVTTGTLDAARVDAVPETLLDAKGDLIAGSADNTAAKVTVGANDTVLTADSTQPAGVKWATPAGGGATRRILSESRIVSLGKGTSLCDLVSDTVNLPAKALAKGAITLGFGRREAVTLNTIGFNVTATALTGTEAIIFCVYALDSDGLPTGTPQTVSITMGTATGMQRIDISASSITLPSGGYAVGFLNPNGNTGTITFTGSYTVESPSWAGAIATQHRSVVYNSKSLTSAPTPTGWTLGSSDGFTQWMTDELWPVIGATK